MTSVLERCEKKEHGSKALKPSEPSRFDIALRDAVLGSQGKKDRAESDRKPNSSILGKRATKVAFLKSLEKHTNGEALDDIFSSKDAFPNDAFQETEDDPEYVDRTSYKANEPHFPDDATSEGEIEGPENEEEEEEEEEHPKHLIDEPSNHDAVDFLRLLGMIEGLLYPGSRVLGACTDEDFLPENWDERGELSPDDDSDLEVEYCNCSEDEDVLEDVAKEKEKLQKAVNSLPRGSSGKCWYEYSDRLHLGNKEIEIRTDPFSKCADVLDGLLGIFQESGGCSFSELDLYTNAVPSKIAEPFCLKLTEVLDFACNAGKLSVEMNPDGWAWLRISIFHEIYFSSPLRGGTDNRTLVPYFGYEKLLRSKNLEPPKWLQKVDSNKTVSLMVKGIESWLFSYHKKGCPKDVRAFSGSFTCNFL